MRKLLNWIAGKLYKNPVPLVCKFENHRNKFKSDLDMEAFRKEFVSHFKGKDADIGGWVKFYFSEGPSFEIRVDKK